MRRRMFVPSTRLWNAIRRPTRKGRRWWLSSRPTLALNVRIHKRSNFLFFASRKGRWAHTRNKTYFLLNTHTKKEACCSFLFLFFFPLSSSFLYRSIRTNTFLHPSFDCIFLRSRRVAPAIAATAQSCMSYKATRVRARILSRLGLFCFRCWRAKHNEETRRQQTFSYFFSTVQKKIKNKQFISKRERMKIRLR